MTSQVIDAGAPVCEAGAMTAAVASPAAPPLAGPLKAMALGRIALGALSLAAPDALARGAGVPATPQLAYMTRIFGARAIALGAGYLTAPPAERRRWQRLALLVDASDTATGLRQLARRELPGPSAAGLVALTGSYLAIGAARLARDLRSGRHPAPTRR